MTSVSKNAYINKLDDMNRCILIDTTTHITAQLK